ncbi:MAG: glycosyltransferase [Exiguobacterium sp.]|uniref:glycosyltransferase family 2 protein n=1 Tax=Exiguobacterium sp. AB2 TaxID=1484479 RepID=UPI0004A93ACC|nr:glycosyltransferase [Exiguobacterium sp. AB2]KDN57138.1 glycosyl transferase [Exiguobacterium sp. AB2]MDX5322040.1 glycosyltransferase [Exiguobacterium sp.]MDX5423729.1 glycosyltransferase [Exiguobacterium sp.]MDX6771289.1 glycosyltransferase [Exiguobacterium sp.]
MSPLVTIVIPVHSREAELTELLDSLVVQTYQQFEVVVINNDGPPKQHLLAPFLNRLTIRYIELGENHHVKARNRGVREAAGEYILLLDDDDLLMPTHIELALEDIRSADLVFTDAELFRFEWQDGHRVVTDWEAFAYDLDLVRLRQDSTYIPSGTLYRKRLHDAIGPFDEDVYNYWDWDFILRVSEQGTIAHPARATVLYAFNGTDNLSAKQDETRRRYFDDFCEKHGLVNMEMKNFHIVQAERRDYVRQTERTFTGAFPGRTEGE